MSHLWILTWNWAQTLELSPERVFLVVRLSVLGMYTGPFPFEFFSFVPLIKLAGTFSNDFIVAGERDTNWGSTDVFLVSSKAIAVAWLSGWLVPWQERTAVKSGQEQMEQGPTAATTASQKAPEEFLITKALDLGIHAFIPTRQLKLSNWFSTDSLSLPFPALAHAAEVWSRAILCLVKWFSSSSCSPPFTHWGRTEVGERESAFLSSSILKWSRIFMTGGVIRLYLRVNLTSFSMQKMHSQPSWLPWHLDDLWWLFLLFFAGVLECVSLEFVLINRTWSKPFVWGHTQAWSSGRAQLPFPYSTATNDAGQWPTTP